MHKLRSILFVAAGIFLPAAAHAQGEPPATPPQPPSTAPPAAPSPPEAPPSRSQQLRKLSDQVAAQQKQLDEQAATIKRLEETVKGGPPPPAPTEVPKPPPPSSAVAFGAPAGTGAEGRETGDDPRKQILVYGYVQGQFQTDASSQNVLAQDGRSLNQNRFTVPRARLVVEREWRLASFLVELDGNTNNGPGFGLQRAEATVLYRGRDNDPPTPPLLSATLGQFRVPFGEENLQSPGVRWFMERSLVSRAFFPSEIDVGLRLAGAIGWFRYQLAATNGHPLQTREFPLSDPDSAKDVGGRLGFVAKAAPRVGLQGGISSLLGRGFHQEPTGIKPQVQWVDRNGDGIFQPEEVTGVDAVAARPASTYRRFGFAIDGKVSLAWPVGETEVAAAVYLGSNLDRGVFGSDPVLLGRDTRHVGYMLSATQELGEWFVVGFRTDFYNPDSDSSDFQNAKPVQPNDRSIRTYSPMVGLRWEKRARLLFQYDVVRDHLARDEAGLPKDLSNDRMTVRLQVNL